MKICFFGDGESIHMLRWCKHFAELGHEVHLISFKKVTIPNIVTHYIDAGSIAVEGGSWKVLLKFNQIKKTVKQLQPDIFHAHYATSYGITGALCNYHPYVISIWGSDILISPNNSRIIRTLLKFAFSQADWVTVVATHMQNALTKLGVNNSKISTVTHGVNPQIFNSDKRKLPTDTFYITSTRSFEPVYNIPHVINSFAEAKKLQPNLHLNLVGGGSLKSEIEQLVKEKGISDSVTFYGRITQPEIATILNQSHLFITVALSDGDVVSLAEAIACDNFCIASDIPANRQWLEENKNGYFVKINDVQALTEKILETYNNYDKLAHSATPLNARIIKERGTWSTNMQLVEEKYKLLIQQHRSN